MNTPNIVERTNELAREAVRREKNGQSGETQRNEIARLNQNLAHTFARKYENWVGEDARSAATVGLIKASKTYNPEKGKFSTWAYYEIRNELLDLVHKTNYEHINKKDFLKQAHNTDRKSTTSITFEPEYAETLPDPTDVEKETITKLTNTSIRDAVNNLPPLQKYLVGRLNGLHNLPPASMTDLSKTLGHSRQWLYVTYQKALDTLCEELKDLK